uniref:Uncharacterized protein n=1 Tax=Arundo donax TaxID=35708 RepID=A0A0A9H0R3_ARUDO
MSGASISPPPPPPPPPRPAPPVKPSAATSSAASAFRRDLAGDSPRATSSRRAAKKPCLLSMSRGRGREGSVRE